MSERETDWHESRTAVFAPDDSQTVFASEPSEPSIVRTVVRFNSLVLLIRNANVSKLASLSDEHPAKAAK